jgi:hypothetical protein
MPAASHVRNSFFPEAPFIREVLDPTISRYGGAVRGAPCADSRGSIRTLNIRGTRSKADSADNDPKTLEALETTRAQDADWLGLETSSG